MSGTTAEGGSIMSNKPDYVLGVLATSSEEIDRIAGRLKQSSSELGSKVAWKCNSNPEAIDQPLAELVRFEPNPMEQQESSINARSFTNSFISRCICIVRTHIFEVSEEFPNAVFLLDFSDIGNGRSGKMVVRAGKVVRYAFDWNQWVIPDIFAPFKEEWTRGMEFESLWAQWVEDLASAAERLKTESAPN
jgi:hypothetical protein